MLEATVSDPAATAAEPLLLDYAPRPKHDWPRLIIVVVGIWAACFVAVYRSPSLRNWPRKQAFLRAKAEISSLQTAVDAFNIDTGSDPMVGQGLGALLAPPAGVTNWHGPYISTPRQLVDPWGTPYFYKPPPGRDLFSAGPDKIFGTKDDIHDW